ncbi:hypothetical protein D3C84_555110 [compost metagenome]
MAGGLPRQLLGKAALTGETDQPCRRVAARLREAFAGVLDLAFLASTIEVQHPARDEEQRHGQRGDRQDDSPADAEVTADVQRVDAGQQLRLEALVAVAVMALDDAGGRIEADLVQCAVMGRTVQQIEHGCRLPGHWRHTNVVGTQGRAGGAVDAAPHCRVIGGRCRAGWRRTTAAPDALILR